MLEAIVGLDDAELAAIGFDGLVARLREAGVRDVTLLEDRGETCVPQVELDSRVDPRELEGLDCVDRCELVAERGGVYRYLLELTATELPEGTAADHEALLGNCEPTVTDRGLLLSLVGSREAIRELLADYEAAGVAPDLRKLADYEGRPGSFEALTDRQLEVLETAYELGFYEVPRESSTEEVADEVGLDPATVAEHLQRAERNLLADELSS